MAKQSKKAPSKAQSDKIINPEPEPVVQSEQEVEQQSQPEPNAESEPASPSRADTDPDALLRDPQCPRDIVLDFGLDAPSSKMQSYILRRKEQYLSAHSLFKQRHAKIMEQCNIDIAALANAVRRQIQTSDHILKDIATVFCDEGRLSEMAEVTDVDEYWALITKEFALRQTLSGDFDTQSQRVERQRRDHVNTQINALQADCAQTGLVPLHRIAQSMQPKQESIAQFAGDRLKCYTQFIRTLRNRDIKLEAEYADQYRDGTLRWNQLHRAPPKQTETDTERAPKQQEETEAK